MSGLPSNFFGFMAFMSMSLMSGGPLLTLLAPPVDLWTASMKLPVRRLEFLDLLVVSEAVGGQMFRSSTFVLTEPSSCLRAYS